MSPERWWTSAREAARTVVLLLGRPVLRLRVTRDMTRAEVVRRGRLIWMAEIGIEGPTDLADALGDLAAVAGLKRFPRRLTVELDRSVAQVRVLAGLPAVSGVALERIVAHQARRFFRKNGCTLVTGARWIDGRTRRSAIAAAVDESWINAITTGARTADLNPVSIVVPVTDSLCPVRLISTAQVARAARSARRLAWRLGIASAVLWSGALVTYIARLSSARASIDEELTSLQVPVAAVAAARREMGEAMVMIDAIVATERQRGRLIEAVTRIVEALPDSAYLTSLAIDPAGGELTGSASEAAAVVAALERRRAVNAPRLEGAAVREPVAGRRWERFTLRFNRKPTR